MKPAHFLVALFTHMATADTGGRGGYNHGRVLQQRAAPVPGADGICYTYTIQQGDTCATLSDRYQITTANIEAWNTGSWDWRGCTKMQQGDFICLSTGAFPMPVALPQATCGPQVPGTARPDNYANLASLNPCPSDQCCNKSGQCSTSPDSCDATKSCIFNCGEKSPPKQSTANIKTLTTASKPTTTSTTSKAPTTSKTRTTLKVTTSSKTSTTSKVTTTNKVIITSTKTTIKEVPATKTTSTVNPTETWQLTLYEDADCKGNYFSIQGHENKYVGNCIVLSEDTNTEISDTTTSCRWWTEGGLNWHTCATSKVTMPKSWFVDTGECYVYIDKNCKELGGLAYAPFQKCQKSSTSVLNNHSPWGSMICWYSERLPT
ncbi:hypothetical protein N7461_000753 [Penicillium sp. DV-2018c]|nr:hypothetical protein N7461_000753 [Penicillium sp. DV-2018c]